jgi:hypothetical protein
MIAENWIQRSFLASDGYQFRISSQTGTNFLRIDYGYLWMIYFLLAYYFLSLLLFASS